MIAVHARSAAIIDLTRQSILTAGVVNIPAIGDVLSCVTFAIPCMGGFAETAICGSVILVT